MADVSLFRGGTADFKGWFRRGDYAEFQPPFNAPQMASTPPYNSHADAAYGQGYLNLHFPLVPHIEDTTAHGWMGEALKKLSAVGDCIYTNWVPLRSVVTHMHWEVTRWDESLENLAVVPTAARMVYDFDTGEFSLSANAAFDTMIVSNNIGGFNLDAPGDTGRYAVAINDDPLCTFGHSIAKLDSTTMQPTGGLDGYFGAVVIGYKITSGTDEAIANMWKGNFALYSSFKCLAFEGASQV